MKEKNNEQEAKSINNPDIKSKNSNEFDNLIKFIDNNININQNDISNEIEQKIIYKLKDLSNIEKDITLLLDKNNNTLIQYYISKDLDNIELILIIINYYKKVFSEDNQEKFYNWLINDNIYHQNFFETLIEKQYPLKKQIEFFNKTFLYINSGDNSLIYKILKNRNNNIIHLVIKQNNIPVLLYLYDKLKDYFPSTNILDIPNNEGMTPLHLSCSYSFKNISDTLLLLGCNINLKDPKGYTPLHYAVKAENYRLCKKLIIFGAKKNLTDNENNTPGDIAKKTSNFSIRKLFTKNFFNQIDSIVNKRRDNLLFILLIIFSTLKYFFFFKSFNANNIMNYIYIISFIIDVICILLTIYPKLCPNKLLINKKRPIIVYNFEDIFEQNDYNLDKIELLCPVCKIIKLKQSKIMHCIICNKCIDNWDHHCFWLNICINKDNYNFFRIFTIFLFLNISINTYIFIFIASDIKIFSPNFNYINAFLLLIIILLIIILLYGNVTLIRQIYLIRKNKKIEKEKIVSLEDFLSNSNNSLLSENLNKEDKDINANPNENQSIEFQEINN